MALGALGAGKVKAGGPPYRLAEDGDAHTGHLYGRPQIERRPVTSVLQDWVAALPLREQGTLMTCIRGCDLTPKEPIDSLERQLVGFLRWCILNPADEREVDVPGAFFQSGIRREWKASELGHYPLHWYTHAMHSAEVIGYRHPDRYTAHDALRLYLKMVHALHLHPETREQMIERLSEDRIAVGEIVS